MKIFGYEIVASKKREIPAIDHSNVPASVVDGGESTIQTEKRSENPKIPVYYGGSIASGAASRASITTPNGSSSLLAIPTVYACVRILSDHMASLPLKLMKKQEDSYFQPYTNHPAYRLFRRPNKYQTGFDFRRALFASAYLFGNGIAYIKRNGAAQPIEAHVVPPGNVSLGDYDGQLYYIIRPLSPSGQLMEQIVLPSTDVIHIKALNLDVTGIDIIQAHRGTFGLAEAAQTYANQYFTNGASFSGVVEHPMQLGDTGFANIRTSIKEQQTSTGSVLVLEEGAKYVKLNDTMVNSGVVDVRKYSAVDIARLYGVPNSMINENAGTTFSNQEEMNNGFCQNTLVPMCEQAEAQFDLTLLTERDFSAESMHFEHDFSNLLRGNMKTQLEIMRFMLTNGVLRRNEVRDWHGSPRDPDLDNYLTPLNMTTGAEATEDPQPTEAKSE